MTTLIDDPPVTGTASAEEAAADAEAITASVRDPDRFTPIFDRHFAAIHAYVARRLGVQAADDLAAETFLIAFRQRHRFDRRHGIARGWLFGIATNLIRRYQRDQIRGRRAVARVGPPPTDGAHDDPVAANVTAHLTSEPLSDALARVKPKDLEVLLLVAFAELTYEETAAALGIAYGTVCSRLSRARRVIRDSLGHDADSAPGPDADSAQKDL
ncbi:RNA polymerase sigma factor [Kribbella deserti]|uniref:RNA polymerase sigma factor n=1 Tax=Kribbella deserti TaxID=1926257 RepID=A0ABV6QH34_9ACTN